MPSQAEVGAAAAVPPARQPARERRPSLPLLPRCSQQLEKLRGEIRAVVTTPKHCLPFLQPGRLVRVLPPEQPPAPGGAAAEAAAAAAATSSSSGGGGGGAAADVLGVVVNFERVGRKEQQGEEEGGSSRSGKNGRGAQYLVDVLCNCSAASLRHQGANKR